MPRALRDMNESVHYCQRRTWGHEPHSMDTISPNKSKAVPTFDIVGLVIIAHVPWYGNNVRFCSDGPPCNQATS